MSPGTSRLEFAGAAIAHAGAGSTPPVVVFQSGLGDGMPVWAEVIRRLPPEVSTFAYDRPGYGGSPTRPGRRDPCTVARELHDLLHAAGRRPPYLLVGHSLGGLYQYAFARLYPEQVAGLLLIDPTHPDHWSTIQQRAPDTARLLRALRALAFSDAEKREFDDQSECLAELRERRPGDAAPAPARLLMRGRAERGESAEFRAISAELAARWPALLPGLSLASAEGAGHYIQKERPELVAQEIRHLLDRARAATD